MSKALRTFFSTLPTAVATPAQLAAAGFHPQGAAVRSAVRAGALRSGVTGYWLPTAGDPGARIVMECAIRSPSYATE